MEVSITDKAEELEIGKPTKVGFFFVVFLLFFFSKCQTIFFTPTNQGKSLTCAAVS